MCVKCIVQAADQVSKYLTLESDGPSADTCMARIVMRLQGDNLEISGREYRNHIVARLLGISWSKSLLTKMAGMLRELPLETDHAEDFVKKVFTHMKDVEPQDLPTLVYQLLLLASHGHKRAIISGIMSFFGNLQDFEAPRGVQNGSKHGNITTISLLRKSCGKL